MVVDNISTTYLIPKAILLIGIGFAVISAVVYIQLQATMIVMSGGCRLLHTLLPLNLREERFVMGPGALTVIFWLRYLSEHVQYDK